MSNKKYRHNLMSRRRLRESNAFSCACLSFCPQGGPDVTINHDALDLSVKSPLPVAKAPAPLDITNGTPRTLTETLVPL